MSEHIRKRVHQRFSSRRPIVDEMYDECFELFKEWKESEPDLLSGDGFSQETIDDARLSLKLYIKDRVKKEKRRSVIPPFIWWWLINQVVTYIVKLIIENYFLSQQFDIDTDDEPVEDKYYKNAPNVNKNKANEWSLEVLIYWAFDDHTKYSFIQRNNKFFLYKEKEIQETFDTEEELKTFLLKIINEEK